MQNLGRYLAATKDDNLTCKHSGPSALCCFFSPGASTTRTWAGSLSSERRGLPLALRRPPDHRLGLPGPPLWLGSPQLPAPGRGPRPAAPSSFQDHPGPVAFCNCKGLCLAPLRSRKARPLRTVRLCPGAQLRAGPASGGGWETCVSTHQGVDLLASTDRPRDFPAGGRAPHGKRAPSAPFDEMLDAGHPWEDAGHRLHPGRQQLL